MVWTRQVSLYIPQLISYLDTAALPKAAVKTTIGSAKSTTQAQSFPMVEPKNIYVANKPTEMAELQPPMREEAEANVQNSQPSHSSSVSDLKSDTGTAVQQPIAPPEGSSRTGSLTARGEKERNGSIASSRRSKQVRQETSPPAPVPAAPQTPEKPSITTTAPRTLSEPKKKTGFSRLISSLVCCGMQTSGNPIEQDSQTTPARKSSKLQPVQARQTTPTRKPASNVPQSSEESKDMSEEKIGGPPYSDIKPAQQPRILERQKEESSTKELQSTANQDEARETSPVPPNTQRSAISPVPVPPNSSEPAATSSSVRPEGSSANPVILSNPTLFPASSMASPLTQADQDGDVEMVDTSDHTPVAPEPNADVDTRHVGQTQVIAQATQESHVPAASDDHRQSVTSTAPLNEKQTWLLPPIRPEFNGKKCLVLDLDETLVHSSFKVG